MSAHGSWAAKATPAGHCDGIARICATSPESKWDGRHIGDVSMPVGRIIDSEGGGAVVSARTVSKKRSAAPAVAWYGVQGWLQVWGGHHLSEAASVPRKISMLAGGLRRCGQSAGHRSDDDEALAGLGIAGTLLSRQWPMPGSIGRHSSPAAADQLLSGAGAGIFGGCRQQAAIQTSISHTDNRPAVSHRITRAMWLNGDQRPGLQALAAMRASCMRSLHRDTARLSGMTQADLIPA